MATNVETDRLSRMSNILNDSYLYSLTVATEAMVCDPIHTANNPLFLRVDNLTTTPWF